METAPFFNIFLILHLSGFTVLVGTTIIDYILLKLFWAQYRSDKTRAAGIALALAKFPTLTRVAAATLIISGIGMMALTHGVIGDQIWFRIKFGVVVVLILNIFLLGRRQYTKFKLRIADNEPENSEKLLIIKQRLQLFHALQLFLLLVIVVLSVFKFN